jgi:hypothetical protein
MGDSRFGSAFNRHTHTASCLILPGPIVQIYKSPDICEILPTPQHQPNTSVCLYIYYCELPFVVHPYLVCILTYPLSTFSPSIVMGKHWHHHQSSDGPQPNKASAQPSRPSSTTSSLLKALSGRTGEGKAQQPAASAAPSASENPTPIQAEAHDRPAAKPTRIPAVTSKAMTTAPVKDKSRPHRRKYPT